MVVFPPELLPKTLESCEAPSPLQATATEELRGSTPQMVGKLGVDSVPEVEPKITSINRRTAPENSRVIGQAGAPPSTKTLTTTKATRPRTERHTFEKPASRSRATMGFQIFKTSMFSLLDNIAHNFPTPRAART